MMISDIITLHGIATTALVILEATRLYTNACKMCFHLNKHARGQLGQTNKPVITSATSVDMIVLICTVHVGTGIDGCANILESRIRAWRRCLPGPAS